MPRTRALTVVVLVLGLSMRTSVGSMAAESPRLWSPNESYQGGSQSDPRLDQPVKMWEAGIEVGAVFAEIGKQTGVKVECSPPDGEGAWLPVNVFLNEKKPPSLREFLVQLSWVLDDNFFVEGEAGKQVYSLMQGATGAGAEERLERAKRQVKEEQKRQFEAAKAFYADLLEALKLSREEVVEKYQGNDRMLLTLLDTRQRAGAELLVLDLSAFEHLTTVNQPSATYTTSTKSCANLTEEQRDTVRGAFGLASGESLEGKELRMTFCGAGQAWASLVTPGVEEWNWPRWSLAPLRAGDDSLDFQESERLSLRLALGEEVPAEEQKAFLDTVQKERTRKAQREEQGPVFDLPQTLKDKLSGIELELTFDNQRLPWVFEDRVAKAAGINIIADAILQRVMISPPPFKPGKGGRHQPYTAYEALQTFMDKDPNSHPPMQAFPFECGWTGSLLRIRTADRDVWRAARYPKAYLDWIDTLVKPAVPSQERLEKGSRRVQVHLTPEPISWSRRYATLSDFQKLYGWKVNYSNAREPLSVLRQGVLWQVSLKVPMRYDFVRTLTPEQWQKLSSDGLIYPHGFPGEQAARLAKAYSDMAMGTAKLKENRRLLIRAVNTDGEADEGADCQMLLDDPDRHNVFGYKPSPIMELPTRPFVVEVEVTGLSDAGDGGGVESRK